VSPPGVRGPLGGLGEKEVAQEAAPGAEIGWLRCIMSFEFITITTPPNLNPEMYFIAGWLSLNEKQECL